MQPHLNAFLLFIGIVPVTVTLTRSVRWGNAGGWHEPPIVRLALVCTTLWVLAIACWVADRLFCDWWSSFDDMPYPQYVVERLFVMPEHSSGDDVRLCVRVAPADGMPFGTSLCCVRRTCCWCWGHFVWHLKNGQTSSHSSTCGLHRVGGRCPGRWGSRLWTLFMPAPTNNPAPVAPYRMSIASEECYHYMLRETSDSCVVLFVWFVFFIVVSHVCPTLLDSTRFCSEPSFYDPPSFYISYFILDSDFL